MKRWIDKNGNFWNNRSIVISGLRIFNPTEELLITAGYIEYIKPEPTSEELLEIAKQNKLNEINLYDSSNAVNSFTLGDKSIWLTVEERLLIATLISANEAIERETMTRWFEGLSFTFPLSVWKLMLIALEVYAGDALNVTESHKAAVKALDNIEDVLAYDITSGYPEKLNFNDE